MQTRTTRATRRIAALLAAALAFGMPFAVISDDLQSNASRQAKAREIRAKAKAGALHPCVSETVTDLESQPVITFENHCTHQANVMLCVSVSGQQVAQYLLLVGGASKVNHRLWITGGNPFRYSYNSCDRPYCTPPRSEC
jgi:hypothetical protein